MKIERIEPLRADGVWRNFDFLKITTDNGLVGWSEFNESFGGHGVTAMIQQPRAASSSGRTRAGTKRSLGVAVCPRDAPRRAASRSRPSPPSRMR